MHKPYRDIISMAACKQHPHFPKCSRVPNPKSWCPNFGHALLLAIRSQGSFSCVHRQQPWHLCGNMKVSKVYVKLRETSTCLWKTDFLLYRYRYRCTHMFFSWQCWHLFLHNWKEAHLHSNQIVPQSHVVRKYTKQNQLTFRWHGFWIGASHLITPKKLSLAQEKTSIAETGQPNNSLCTNAHWWFDAV